MWDTSSFCHSPFWILPRWFHANLTNNWTTAQAQLSALAWTLPSPPPLYFTKSSLGWSVCLAITECLLGEVIPPETTWGRAYSKSGSFTKFLPPYCLSKREEQPRTNLLLQFHSEYSFFPSLFLCQSLDFSVKGNLTRTGCMDHVGLRRGSWKPVAQWWPSQNRTRVQILIQPWSILCDLGPVTLSLACHSGMLWG